MGSKDPETVVLSPECLDGCPLGKIPDPYCLVFSARNDELVLGMEQSSRDVVEVASARVNLPCLRVAHAPELNLPVVSRRHDERERGVELCPVYTAVVPFEDVFDRRERVEGLEPAWS